MGKKQINQSLQKELSWYLSTPKYLQEGIEMVKQQREIIELPLDLSINLIPPKKKEDLMVVARRAEAVADAWIKHLSKRYGVPNDVLERLRGRLGHGCGVDFFNPQADDDLIKLFALILADFKRNCDEAMDFLLKKVSTIGDDIEWGTDYARNHISRVDIDWRKQISIDGTEVDLHLGQPSGRDGRISLTWDSSRGVYTLGEGSNLLSKIISEIKIQALNTVFSFPGKASAEDFFRWVTANWGGIN